MTSPTSGASRTRDRLDAAPGRPFIPLQRSPTYSGWWGDRELMAEAIRAYIVDPNYIKTAAPELAAAIREAVNSNPILAPIIQFNNLRLPTHAGLEQSPEQLPTTAGYPEVRRRFCSPQEPRRPL